MRDRRLEGMDNFNVYRDFETEGEFQFPVIKPVYELPKIERWLDLQEFRELNAKGADLSKCGLQLYNWDYQIQCLWLSPQKYTAALKKLAAVCAPDFSMYTDMPVVMQMWNHYKQQWLGAYWQANGVTVIPSIGWSTPESCEWAFDGVPRGGIVSVSTQGVRRNTEQAREFFRRGWGQATLWLNPCGVICYGKPFDFMTITEQIKTVGMAANEIKKEDI